MEERSSGAVVFRETPGGRMYLLLRNANRWDFPKGGVEEGETDLQAAAREVQEETGLKDVRILPGFKKVIEYFYRRGGKNVHKQVVYHVAVTHNGNVKISFEHQGFGWFRYRDAMDKASYENSKLTLAEAEKFVSDGSRTRPAGADQSA